jgi:hypothetical protein
LAEVGDKKKWGHLGCFTSNAGITFTPLQTRPRLLPKNQKRFAQAQKAILSITGRDGVITNVAFSLEIHNLVFSCYTWARKKLKRA